MKLIDKWICELFLGIDAKWKAKSQNREFHLYVLFLFSLMSYMIFSNTIMALKLFFAIEWSFAFGSQLIASIIGITTFVLLVFRYFVKNKYLKMSNENNYERKYFNIGLALCLIQPLVLIIMLFIIVFFDKQ